MPMPSLLPLLQAASTAYNGIYNYNPPAAAASPTPKSASTFSLASYLPSSTTIRETIFSLSSYIPIESLRYEDSSKVKAEALEKIANGNYSPYLEQQNMKIVSALEKLKEHPKFNEGTKFKSLIAVIYECANLIDYPTPLNIVANFSRVNEALIPVMQFLNKENPFFTEVKNFFAETEQYVNQLVHIDESRASGMLVVTLHQLEKKEDELRSVCQYSRIREKDLQAQKNQNEELKAEEEALRAALDAERRKVQTLEHVKDAVLINVKGLAAGQKELRQVLNTTQDELAKTQRKVAKYKGLIRQHPLGEHGIYATRGVSADVGSPLPQAGAGVVETATLAREVTSETKSNSL